ncbi:MAG: ribonuclease R family protein [Phycisphaerales bacterium]
MPLRYKARILDHLSDARYEPADADSIAETFRVEDAEEREAFDAAIEELEEEGKLQVDSKDRLRLPRIADEIVGVIRLHPKGFAFVVPNEVNREGDLFIPAGETADAVNGDHVRVKVLKARPRGKRPPGTSPFIGRVVEVLERGRSTYVGTLTKKGSEWIVETDGRQLNAPIVVRDPGAKDAKVGDKVVVEMLYYPEPGEYGEGVITRKLGEAGRPDVETEAVIVAYDLPGEFPEDAVEQARNAAGKIRNIDAEVEQREDLREKFIITIDPPDARDFDDAISIERLDDGGFELGVHIADVSFFVGPGSPLDTEARDRGNSVYLPRHVIPMLPEVLSNGVCSLQEDVDRLTKSVFIRFDGRGRVQNSRCSATIIRSKKRLTYLEAEELIKSGDEKKAREYARSDLPYPKELKPTLAMMDDLAKRIRKRRLDDGMIVLTLPEVELVFDDDGHVIDAEPEDDASTHGLIEMFMVEANEAVARLFDWLAVPILRRTHPDPSTFDMSELRLFARVAGVNIPRNPTRFELQRILDMTRGTPRQQAIHFAVLKTLTKAEYSPAIIGHFALASAHYAHFTSPIRRYPDLLLHRALTVYLEHTKNGRKHPKGKGRSKLGRTILEDPRVLGESKLMEAGTHCNETERNAELAERSLRSFLVMQLLEEKHMGDVFEGVVTNVSSNAIFVQLSKYLVEGMIKVSDLPAPGGDRQSGPERWKINQNTGALVAQKSGATINVGDPMKIQIVAVDPAARRLDLAVHDDRKSKVKEKTPRSRVGGDGRGSKRFKPLTFSKKKSPRQSKRRRSR